MMRHRPRDTAPRGSAIRATVAAAAALAAVVTAYPAAAAPHPLNNDAAGVTGEEVHTGNDSSSLGSATADTDLAMDRSALSALAARHDTAALAVSSTFVADFGYRPVFDGREAARPDGSCSSLIPLPAAFQDPCAAHDFGYDLLRRSAPDQPGVRSRIDGILVERLSDLCSTTPAPTGTAAGCRLTVSLVDHSLRFNTWRQEGGAPVPESIDDIAASLPRRAGAALWEMLP